MKTNRVGEVLARAGLSLALLCATSTTEAVERPKTKKTSRRPPKLSPPRLDPVWVGPPEDPEAVQWWVDLTDPHLTPKERLPIVVPPWGKGQNNLQDLATRWQVPPMPWSMVAPVVAATAIPILLARGGRVVRVPVSTNVFATALPKASDVDRAMIAFVLPKPLDDQIAAAWPESSVWQRQNWWVDRQSELGARLLSRPEKFLLDYERAWSRYEGARERNEPKGILLADLFVRHELLRNAYLQRDSAWPYRRWSSLAEQLISRQPRIPEEARPIFNRIGEQRYEAVLALEGIPFSIEGPVYVFSPDGV